MTDNKKTVAPFGSWPSPISSAALTAATIGLSEIHIDPDDNAIYWLESRPEEKGRSTVVQWRNGKLRDLLPSPINVRSKVNEYGGGSYCVHKGIIYFVLFDDQRIYQLDTGQSKAVPEAITQASACRYGDLIFDANRQRLLAVVEDHSNPNSEAQTNIASIALNANGKQQPQTLINGADFYASLQLSADGKQLVWLSWNHPNMPWDGTECWLAEVNSQGELNNQQLIAGGKTESIMQPRFSPNGDLIFVSDRNNWWNLYRHRNNDIQCLYAMDAEFVGPQWVFGQSFYSIIDEDTIVGCYTQAGSWHLYHLQISSQRFATIPTPCVDIAYVSADRHSIYFVGAGTKDYNAIYQLNLHNSKLEVSKLQAPVTCNFNGDDVSVAQSIEFPLSTRNGTGKAFYYPPANAQYCGPNNQAPPVLVFCHGGPTSATHCNLNLKIQYWTSRGIAVADINYGGSTGFGRHYRQALIGQWGIVDVQDSIDCVNFLVAQGLAAKDKLAIRGGSAGGYTVLSALTFHNTFKAGASHYGVGDLETLATDTHKFESRYLDSLIGPYPQEKQLYYARSPINHIDGLSCPVIFFQGLQDKVVPPNQADAMVEALDKKSIAHSYVVFPDEGHGFRQAPNQRRALDAELYFYSKVFGFDLAENIEPVEIKHLHQAEREG